MAPERLDIALKEEVDHQRNCLGTAMYLAGVVSDDAFMSSSDVLPILDGLDKTADPEPGHLVVLRHPVFRKH